MKATYSRLVRNDQRVAPTRRPQGVARISRPQLGQAGALREMLEPQSVHGTSVLVAPIFLSSYTGRAAQVQSQRRNRMVTSFDRTPSMTT
jgi:hypothetical protein